jgi:peptidoglycan hydrolase CwlO-like protein
MSDLLNLTAGLLSTIFVAGFFVYLTRSIHIKRQEDRKDFDLFISRYESFLQQKQEEIEQLHRKVDEQTKELMKLHAEYIHVSHALKKAEERIQLLEKKLEKTNKENESLKKTLKAMQEHLKE